MVIEGCICEFLSLFWKCDLGLLSSALSPWSVFFVWFEMSRVDNVERQSAHNWPHMFCKVCRTVTHKAALMDDTRPLLNQQTIWRERHRWIYQHKINTLPQQQGERRDEMWLDQRLFEVKERKGKMDKEKEKLKGKDTWFIWSQGKKEDWKREGNGKTDRKRF